MQRSLRSIALSIAILSALTVAAPLARAQAVAQFDLPAQPLADSLRAVAKQTNSNVLFDRKLVRGRTAPALKAQGTLDAALIQLLEGSGLKHQFVDEKTVTVVDPTKPAASRRSEAEAGVDSKPTASNLASPAGSERYTRLAQAETAPAARTPTESAKRVELEEVVVAIPEVLVVGSKILNMDTRRTEDDAQPYVVFDREAIARSGARNLEDFFKTRLPMNTQAIGFGQLGGDMGNRSQINLRGLGTNQTLILIDGHRATSPISGSNSAPQQADLNGIPLEAIERIEVLPSTASGIYGGNATGGVINIIRRRDYEGTEVKLSYDSAFDGSAFSRRIDIGSGFTLEDGKTQVMLAASYADSDELVVGERDLIGRGRATILQNNPGFFFSTTSNPVLGATPNIRSANGQDLTLKGSSQSLESPFTFIPAGYRGVALDGTAGLVANAGQYNFDLPDTGQSAAGRKLALSNSPVVESLSVTLRREFGQRVQAFLDLGASNNTSDYPLANASRTYTVAASAPNNPFNQDILVTPPISTITGNFHSTSYERRGVAGVIVKLAGTWQAEADYTWHRTRLSWSSPTGIQGAEAASVRNGSIDVLRDTMMFAPDFSAFDLGSSYTPEPPRSTMEDVTLRTSGAIASLPAGALTLSALLEHRDEQFHGGRLISPLSGEFTYPSRSQSVDSAYLELAVPVVSQRNRMPGVELLDLQLAARWDGYTIKGSTSSIRAGSTTPLERETQNVSSINPTVGLRYQPVADVMVRASFGTGFVPPTVSQLIKNTAGTSIVSVIDPKRSNILTNDVVLAGVGGNPDLEPEESESWSAGVVLTPRFMPEARLSVDYTRIEKSDNIITPSAQQIVDNEDILPGRVIRGPFPGSRPTCVADAICGIDTSVINLARAKVEAYDVQLDYRLQTERAGIFDFFGVATWQTHYQTQVVPQQPFVENVGIGVAFGQGVNPLKLKANAGVTWRYGDWTVGWTARYFDSYLVADPASASSGPAILNQGGGGRVPSQTYHDLAASYRYLGAPEGDFFGALLANTEIQLGVQNVLNEKPPFDASSGSRYYSAFGDPRLATYYVTLRKTF